jgi:hypothetical protein
VEVKHNAWCTLGANIREAAGYNVRMNCSCEKQTTNVVNADLVLSDRGDRCILLCVWTTDNGLERRVVMVDSRGLLTAFDRLRRELLEQGILMLDVARGGGLRGIRRCTPETILQKAEAQAARTMRRIIAANANGTRDS